MVGGALGLATTMAGGPNFAKFADDVLYEIKIDNDGDSYADISYQFQFATKINNVNTFLYNTGPVRSIDDTNRNMYQTYTVTREKLKKGKTVSEKVIARNLPVAPNNVGPKTIPNYTAVANQAIQLHGGIGMTMEAKIGHYFKRLTMIENSFGDTDYHQRRVADAGGLI